jgi:hypothetical protein
MKDKPIQITIGCTPRTPMQKPNSKRQDRIQRKLQRLNILINLRFIWKDLLFYFQWLPESSANKSGAHLRAESKNQFAPQGENPKEFKNQQKQVNFCSCGN